MSTETCPRPWVRLPADTDAADVTEPGTAAPTFGAVIPTKSPLQAHVVTPLPPEVRAHLAGDIGAVAPAALLVFAGPRTSVLTAAICAAVHAAPAGYTAAEMVMALGAAGVRHPRLHVLVMGALSSQAQVGHLGRHLEVVQERCTGHQDDILRTVSVYTKPRPAGSFEAYGGFRDPDCPKCFRGELLVAQLLPAAVHDFVRRVRGPITVTATFHHLRASAHTWATGGGPHPLGVHGRPRVPPPSSVYR